MNELLTIQNSFQDFLIQDDKEIYQSIVDTGKVSAETRLEIYRNAYRYRLIDALAANYPILKIYIGDDQFEDLGIAYLDKYPSNFRSIRWFGDQLVNFLNDNLPYKSFPYLSELAKLEWAMTLTFDAADSEIIDIETVKSIPPEDWAKMRLQPHPSTYLLSLSWNVVQIWQELSEDQDPHEPIQNDHPVNWLLWRKDLINQFCSLDNEEACAIEAMLKGLTFNEICEQLLQWFDPQDAAIHAASFLKGWIMSGLISGISLGTGSSLES